jgi:hypothetical protein
MGPAPPSSKRDPRAEIEENVDEGPDTKRPSYSSQELAIAVETAKERATLPPAPAYEELRDSCRKMPVAAAVKEGVTESVPKPPPLPQSATRQRVPPRR